MLHVCPIVFNFLLLVVVLNISVYVCDVDNKNAFYACLPNQILNQDKFSFFFWSEGGGREVGGRGGVGGGVVVVYSPCYSVHK